MTVRRVLALLWLVVPPLLLSALVHTTDPDIGGVGRLTSRSAVFSVIFYGVPVVGLCLAVLAAALRRGRGAGALAGAAAALLVALVLVVAQRREGTWLDDAWSLFGGTVIVFAFLALAVAPATVLGWPRSGAAAPPQPGPG